MVKNTNGKRKAEVVNEHIEPRSGFRFVIADACDFTVTPVYLAELPQTQTPALQYCGMSRKAEETRNKLSRTHPQLRIGSRSAVRYAH